MITVDLIVINAGELVTAAGVGRGPKRGQQLNGLGIIASGALAAENGRIVATGSTDEIVAAYNSRNVIDAAGKLVMPGFVDPHTHLVFAGSRSGEYERKITGESYADAQRKGGGIHSTVRSTREASGEELVIKAMKSLDTALLHGTTTIEIKSGYGLDRDNELKILETIRTLRDRHPVSIVTTFLGAHMIPEEYLERRAAYIKLVKTLLPEIAARGLAGYCDVYCDRLGFTVSETRDILETARKIGYKLKVHAEQTAFTGGSALAAEMGAVSADHLDYICNPIKEGGRYRLSDEHIDILARSPTIGVLLPGVTFHLMEMMSGAGTEKGFLPQTVARLIERDVPVALATDYNPGSSPTLSMQMVVQLAARLFKMSYAQAINASTINAACAIDMANEIGSLEPGKLADIVIYSVEEHGMLIDNFGTNLVDKVIKSGKTVVDGGKLVSGIR